MKKNKIKKVKPVNLDPPKTRREIFLDLIKTQKRQMVSLSMLFFMFLLPLVVDILIFGIFISNIPFDTENYSSIVFSFIFYMMIIAIPCSMLAFLGLSGLAQVCKHIAWRDGVLEGPEFFVGIKNNFKHALVFGFIWGVSLFLLVIGSLFLYRTHVSSELPWVHYVGIGLCIVQFIVLSIVSMHAINYDCYYSNTFREVFKNSFIFFVARFFKNLVLFIFTIGLVVGLCFVAFIAQIVMILVIAFLSSYMMIAWTLLSHDAFDQYINATNYPEYYRKGLYTPTEVEEK